MKFALTCEQFSSEGKRCSCCSRVFDICKGVLFYRFDHFHFANVFRYIFRSLLEQRLGNEFIISALTRTISIRIYRTLSLTSMIIIIIDIHEPSELPFPIRGFKNRQNSGRMRMEKKRTRWDEIPCLDYRFHTPPPSLRVPQSNWPVCRGSANVCPPIYLGTTCVNLRQPR